MSLSPAYHWHDVREWGVEGKGWADTERPFDRLPARASGAVRDVIWNLSRHATGMSVRFETDAPAIAARWTLGGEPLAKPQMPATAVSGLDLYAQGETGAWRWTGVARWPDRFPTVEAELVAGLDGRRRAYATYLPLWNAVLGLEIGVPSGASFAPLPPRPQPPLVVYGTSIVHGAAASRAGMAYPAILGRRLDLPTINLGFAGNAHMEPEVAALLAELAPCAYVVDCLPNMAAPLIEERAVPLVRALRRAHPTTPIVLVEDRTFADAAFRPVARESNRTRRAALRAAYRRLQDEGVSHLTYVPGESLLAADGESTVDGSHPPDLGFAQMAAALEAPVRAALGVPDTRGEEGGPALWGRRPQTP
jgi:hypothetical protein